MSKKSNNRIPSLDGLRGISIIMVIIGHASYSLPEFAQPFTRYFGNASLGVQIFFVLSGFLIFTLSQREIEKNRDFDWRNFYLRRILRIFPGFYFYLLIILILCSVGILSIAPSAIIAASSFSTNYRHLWDGTHALGDYWVVGQYWTLSLEEQFYLLWPLLIFLYKRERLVIILAGFILISPFIRVANYFLFPSSRGQIGMMFHTSFDSIAVGVLLGELMSRSHLTNWIRNLVLRNHVVAISILFLFLISPLLHNHLRGAYILTVGKPLDFIFISLLIVAAISNTGSKLFQILNNKILSYIGVLSYSLYLWNPLFCNPEKNWIITQAPWNLICTFLVGWISYTFVEKPFLKLKGKFHRDQKFLESKH